MISGKGRISSTDGISTACILDHPRRKDYRTFPVLPRGALRLRRFGMARLRSTTKGTLDAAANARPMG
jgi:hypothetical protein